VKPFARTTDAAPVTPSAFDSVFVNAGSGAEWVLVGAPLVLVGAAVVVGVLGVVEGVVFGCVLVAVVETGGTLETVTVLVPDPQAPSSTAPDTPSSAALAGHRARLITLMVFAVRACAPGTAPGIARYATTGRRCPERPRQAAAAGRS
jgi:hypothetical protein